MGAEDTTPRPSNMRPIARRQVEPGAELSSDPHEALGQVMAEVLKVGRSVAALNTVVETQARELNGLRRDLTDDRSVLVNGTSKTAATHTSNRMAVLLGTLFVLYEQAAPILHELWKGLHK